MTIGGLQWWFFFALSYDEIFSGQFLDCSGPSFIFTYKINPQHDKKMDNFKALKNHKN